MKGFKFKYESILSLLEKKEDNVKNKLGIAYNVLNKEKNRLSDLESKDMECSEAIRNQTLSGCKLVFLRNLGSYRNELSNRMAMQNEVIVKKEHEISNIKSELLEVVKEKKIMEKLKEKKLDEYNVTLQKIEEKTIDQLVTYKNSLIHR